MKKTLLPSLAVFIAAIWMLWPRPALSHETIGTTVLFDREIVRILNKRCVSCHFDKGLAFPLTSYQETRPWAGAIKEEALRRHMPPWRALPGYSQFANDNGLTNREMEFIVSWAEGGGPKSAGQTVFLNTRANAAAGDDIRARPDIGHWHLGPPDMIQQLPAYTIEAGQPNHVRRTVVDLRLTSERWVRAMEFMPEDRRVVRAVVFTVQETGQWIGSWTPWYGHVSLPDKTAYRLPAGAHIAAEIHYKGAGEPVEDSGKLALFFADGPAANRPSDLILSAASGTPAGDQKLRYHAQTQLAADTYLLALQPQLAPGIQSIELTARRPDGGTEILLFARDLLIEWPTPYIFKEPVHLPTGTRLSLTTYLDSRAGNPPADGITMTLSRYEAGKR
jgi:hypothetical protein